MVQLHCYGVTFILQYQVIRRNYEEKVLLFRYYFDPLNIVYDLNFLLDFDFKDI